jgi:hypothetical protein
MSQTTAGQPTPDARATALSTKQAAIIGAIAALLSSALTIPTTLIAASRAGDTALQTTMTQLSGETEKSRAEFLRSQRQRLYISVIDRLYVRQDEGERLALQLLNGQVSPRQADRYFTQGFRTVLPTYRSLSSDVAAMDILGSPSTRSIFSELYREQINQHNILVDMVISLADKPHPYRALLARWHRYSRIENRVSTDITELSSAARVDMENE